MKVILAIGSREEASELLEDLPKNFVAMKFLDQIGYLRQTDLFITHGGFNSIKEVPQRDSKRLKETQMLSSPGPLRGVTRRQRLPQLQRPRVDPALKTNGMNGKETNLDHDFITFNVI